MTRFSRLGPALAAAVLPVALLATPAAAHVTLEKAEAPVGSYYKAVLKVGHGCQGSPTTALTVTIPDGLVAAKPMPKAGWTVKTQAGPYDRAYAFHGKEVKDGVRSITWSGGALPDDFYDEFVFIAYLAPEAGARPVPIPVVQTCEKGEHRWVEVAKAEGEKLASPAPVLRISAANAATSAAQVKAGALVIEAPWSRATPGGAKVAGGFLRITNTGTAPERLTGGTFARAGEVQVHEMAMNGGVMTMRQLASGLEIPPGKTVDLAPGGYHLMFMNLGAPLKEGEVVTGTLTFETAGKVDVSYQVRGLGAKAGDPAPAAGGHQH